VTGVPVAKGRPKFSMRGGFARAYTPAKTKDFETLIKWVAQECKIEELMTGPVSVQIEIYLPIPKTFTKKKLALIEKFELRPLTRPDIDNYAKLCLDALNEIIWKDDNQVVSLHVTKWYSDKPRMEVTIKDLST